MANITTLLSLVPENYKQLLSTVSNGRSDNCTSSVSKAIEKPENTSNYDFWVVLDAESGKEVAIKQLLPFRELLQIKGLSVELANKLPNKSVWATIKGSEEYVKNIPQVDTKFVPTFEHILRLQDLAGRRNSVGYGRGYYGYGEAGTGKTSTGLWFCAVTGQPVMQFNCGETTEIDDLFTRQVPINGQWRTVEGSCLTALKRGYWLLVDELDLAPAALPPALNDLIEGHKYAVTGLGESVAANDNFRLLAFGNTGFNCSERGGYNGRNILDASFKSRCICDKYADLSQQTIQQLILNNYPDSGVEFAQQCANFFIGVNQMFEKNNSGELLTPRNMQGFVETALANKDTVKYPLLYAAVNAIPATEEDVTIRDSILNLISAHFKDMLSQNKNESLMFMWEERYAPFVVQSKSSKGKKKSKPKEDADTEQMSKQ